MLPEARFRREMSHKSRFLKVNLTLMLKLQLFGRFRVEDDDGNEIPIKSRKAKALLGYLASPLGKPRSRDAIAALLWSDRADEQARGSLRQALSGLRHDLGDAAAKALVVTQDDVALSPEHVVVESPSPGDEFLESLTINDPAFDEWLRDERLRLEEETAPLEAEEEAPESLDKPSIAVLPFLNISSDPDQEYFADGVTEDIITELSRFRWFLVIARNSSFHYKGQSPRVQDVGRELGVHYVVEGSVRKVENRVRITAQLIDSTNGTPLWAERYDRELNDIFEVQDEVAQAIVSTVAGKLAISGLSPSKRQHPNNLSAYELVIRAKEHLHHYTKSENALARDLFRRATELDPEYALAHVWLGWTHFFDFELGWSDDPEQSSSLGLSCVKRGVDLDSTDAWAQAGLAYGLIYRRQFDLAKVHLERAIKLNPNDADILSQAGLFLSYLGNHKEGVRLLEMARRRNPFGSHWYLWNLGIALYGANRHSEAVAAWSEMSNTPTEIYACLAAAYAQLGQMDEAKKRMATFLERGKDELADFPTGDKEGWLRYWFKSFPYRDPKDLDHLLDGLRKAGLPI